MRLSLRIFPMKDMPKSSSRESDIIPEPSISMEYCKQTLEEIPEQENNEVLRKSKRQRTAKSSGDDFIVYLTDDTPSTIPKAYASFNVGYWKEVVRSEMDSIMYNRTLEIDPPLTPFALMRIPFPSSWIYLGRLPWAPCWSSKIHVGCANTINFVLTDKSEE